MGSRWAVGTHRKSHRSRPGVCVRSQDHQQGAIPGMACARQSQGPSKGSSELSHPQGWLSVRSRQRRHGSGVWETMEDVLWELRGFLRAAAARTGPRATGGSVVQEEIRVFLGLFSRASTKGFLHTSKHASSLSGSHVFAHTSTHPPSHFSRGKKGGLKAGKGREKLGEEEWAGKG